MNYEIMDIDELASICGYFTTKTDANGGYGCNHPDQEEYEMLYRDESGYTHRDDDREPKVRQGKCYSFSCPIASKCNLEDFKEYDPEIYDEIISNNPRESEMWLEVIADSYDMMLVDMDELNDKA